MSMRKVQRDDADSTPLLTLSQLTALACGPQVTSGDER